MATIRFAGFPDGTQVTLAASKNGVPKGPVTVSAWRQPIVADAGDDVGAMTIHALREPSISAPEHVRFTAVVGDGDVVDGVHQGTGLVQLANGFNRDGTANASALYSYVNPRGDLFSYDQQMHELEFIWTFGGTSGTFDKVPRLPAFYRQKNKAYGKYAAHIFETAGTFDVTCEAWRVDYNALTGEQSHVLVARRTIQITVSGTLDTAYPGNQTVCINPDFPAGYTANANALDAEAPVGSVGYDSAASYFADYNARFGNQERRVVFRRGKTHLFFDSIFVGETNLTWAGYGTGAKPILTTGSTGEWSQTAILRNTDNNATPNYGYWRFIGLMVEGPWDERTEEGWRLQLVNPGKPLNLVMLDCEFDGISRAALTQYSGTQPEEFASAWLYDCAVTSFQDYGLQTADSSEQWVIVRGSLVRRRSDADGNSRLNDKTGSNLMNWHGPLRIPTLKVGIVQSSDLYSRASWGNPALAQPCIRVGTDNKNNSTDPKGWWSFICMHNVMEGGSVAVTTKTENGGNRIHPANVLIRRNIRIGDFNSTTDFALARGCTTCAENLTIMPNVGIALFMSASGTLNSNAAQRDRQVTISNQSWDDAQPVAENRQMPMRIFGNTLIDFKTPLNVEDQLPLGGFEQFTGLVEIRDNSRWCPNHAEPETASGPMEVALSIASYNTYPPRYRQRSGGVDGAQVEFPGPDPQGLPYNTPGGSVDVLRPLGNAGVVGSATGPLGIFDVLGTERPAAAAAGAVEPA